MSTDVEKALYQQILKLNRQLCCLRDSVGGIIGFEAIVDDYSDLPSASLHTGEIYYVINTVDGSIGNIWYSNGVSWVSSLTLFDTRLNTLENNVYKITYYEIVSGTIGTITPPTGATFNANEFGDSGDSILSKINVDNKPTFSSPLTAGGVVVTANLNPLTGAWTASGTYTDTSVALIYSIKISASDYSNLNNFYIIEETKLGFTLPSLINGSVLFSNGTTIAEDNSNFFYNDTNNRLGLGTPTPSTTLHLNVPTAADVLSITKTDDVYTYIKGSLLGGAAGFSFGNGSGGVTNMISYSNKMLLTQPLHLASSYSATNTGSWLTISQAPTASANYGLVSLGSGPFDGSTAGFFTGNASGTVLAVNAATGFTGNLLNLQIGGVSKFYVESNGAARVPVGGTFYIDSYNTSLSGTGLTIYGSGSLAGTSNGQLTLNSPAFAPASGTTAYSGVSMTSSHTATNAASGAYKPVAINYTINNTGTASTATATGLFLNATETALNGMAHNLMNLQVGGVSQFKVSNTGLISTPTGIDADATGGGNGYVSAGYHGGLLLNGGVLTINRQQSPNRVNYGSGYSGGHSFVGAGTTTILGVGGAAISALSVTVAPTASSNYGLFSIGSGAFDGSTAGYFTGNAAGTLIAGNLASGSTSDLMNLQVGGVSKIKADKDGRFYAGYMYTKGSMYSAQNEFGSVISATIPMVIEGDWGGTGATAYGVSLGSSQYYGTYEATSFDVVRLGSMSFSKSSGSLAMNFTRIAPTINQTGGANGITRGLYINPTLTSAADFRAIDVAKGVVLMATYTFATLPTGIPTGSEVNISDSNTVTWGATIAGGGANSVKARYNGSNWTVVGI